MVKNQLRPREREQLLDEMGNMAEVRGYSAIGNEIRGGKNVKGNVKYFLSLYKRNAYGKFHGSKPDGSIDREGKINPKARKRYDKVELGMLKGLQLLK